MEWNKDREEGAARKSDEDDKTRGMMPMRKQRYETEKRKGGFDKVRGRKKQKTDIEGGIREGRGQREGGKRGRRN